MERHEGSERSVWFEWGVGVGERKRHWEAQRARCLVVAVIHVVRVR